MPMTDFLALQWEQHVVPVQLQLKKTETELEEQKDIIKRKDLFIHTYSRLIKTGKMEDAFKMEDDPDFADKMIEDYMKSTD